MYALARNSWKYTDRDRRIDKTQLLEFDFLAPDTVGEIITSLTLLEKYTGLAATRQPDAPQPAAGPKFAPTPRPAGPTPARKPAERISDDNLIRIGADLLLNTPDRADELEILADGWENSDRKVKLVKVAQAYALFRRLIDWYAATRLQAFIRQHDVQSFDDLLKALPANPALQPWVNVGGQLIRKSELEKLIGQIHAGKIRSWDGVHQFYIRQGDQYAMDKLVHALAALKTIHGKTLKKMGKTGLAELLRDSIATRDWMTKEIYASREKDYTNPFRKMVYDSPEEMNVVVGRLQDNGFIKQEKEAAKKYRKEIEQTLRRFI